ncbi:MAG: 3-hydroxyacyl-CoA dehydrogenase family protein [Streptosporangiaceae bacterium]
MSKVANKLAVIGSGLMGSGIAQVSAQAGWEVTLHDVREDAAVRGRASISSSYDRFVRKERMSAEDAEAALGRITTTTDIDVAGEADFVVEAVFEELEVKRQVFRELDRVARDDVVLASNTSALPITHIASVTERPERVVGTHFFSPVPMMKLCEIVRGFKTTDDTLRRAREFAEGVGKTCVVVNRDVAGFVTTRLIAALCVEAAQLAESGVASPEDIDTACKLGFGHAMGPLATMDLTGIDIMVHAGRNIYDEEGDPKFLPPVTLRRMADAGQLGRKTGRGYYAYGS